MIKINQLKVSVSEIHSLNNDSSKILSLLLKKAASTINVNTADISDIAIIKRSIDARKKPDLFYVYAVKVTLSKPSLEDKVLKKMQTKKNNNISLYDEVIYDFTRGFKDNRKTLSNRIVIVGAGPAGLFAGYYLAKYGYRPLIIERGKAVNERQEDVERFFETGILDTESNVQFGEGGAGTFSDGKLNTLVKDSFGRNKEVLNLFHALGANESILYDPKPHVGTDVLHDVIYNLREAIIKMGGEVSFQEKLVEINYSNERIISIVTNKRTILVDALVLAIGHSARDTFRMLDKTVINMHAKSFAVGFRVEHPQEMINESQYGISNDILPAAAYKLTHQSTSGRGVYTFCMCPGGYVVNASSENERLAVNGMSYYARDNKNANTAVIVSVTPHDYKGEGALSGVNFQEELEHKAYMLSSGKIPQQLFIDFKNNRASTSYGEYESTCKGATSLTNIRSILPEECNEAFIEGMHAFGHKIKNYDRDDAIISAIESRTSSPVRIDRDENYESNIKGIYPCGEGAGYAGGIMSAAMDGMKVAEAIANNYLPIDRMN